MKENKRQYYVYILLCGDGTFYTGFTTNIEDRLKKHERGKGAKYTRGRCPFTLMYTNTFPTKSEALKAEHAIKKMTRKQKEELIRKGSDPFETAT